MSQLSVELKKWQGEIVGWVEGEAPIVEAEFKVLAGQFKTVIGPAALAAAEAALTDIGQEIAGTLTASTLITQVEALGKGLAALIESTVKALAKQGMTATGTQILGSIAAALSASAVATAKTAT